MPRVGSSKKTIQIAEERKARIAEMYCQGKTQKAIGELVGLTEARVGQILAEARLELQARKLVAVEDRLEIELRSLDTLEEDAKTGWLRSLENSTTTTTMKSPRKKEKNEELNKRLKKADKELRVTSEITMTKGQAGDPSFLKVRHDVINTKLKLLNAFPKEAQGPAVVIQQWPWEGMATPIPFTGAIEATPSQEVEARIEAELKSEPHPNNNGNGNGHV